MANDTPALHDTVRDFHRKYGQPVRNVPRIPQDDEVRFRLRLMAEEFFELYEASLDMGAKGDTYRAAEVRHAIKTLKEAIAGPHPYTQLPVCVDMVAFVDGMADLDYVVEGTRAYFGVDGRPIAAEVHRSNMEKLPCGADGKPVKGPTWQPPRLVAALIEQGWGEEAALVAEAV